MAEKNPVNQKQKQEQPTPVYNDLTELKGLTALNSNILMSNLKVTQKL